MRPLMLATSESGTLLLVANTYHPQTNEKLERYHQSIKQEVNQVPYEAPSDLEEAITGFVDYYNNRRYHKALSYVTPDNVLKGRREEILITRHVESYSLGLMDGVLLVPTLLQIRGLQTLRFAHSL